VFFVKVVDVTRPPRAAIPPLLKDLNERTVLDAIRMGAPISRAEISRRAGISKPTVSLALQSLLAAGLVREAEPDGDGPSYGAVFFEAVPEVALVLGLDLGARFLRGAICDLRGETRARLDVEVAGGDAEAALEAIAGLRTSLVEAAGLPAELVAAAVVGVPGAVQSTGSIKLATNVPGLEGRDFGAELHERLGVTVTLENDINLAALGEQWAGVARGVRDFVFLSIGTGLGAGLVLGGEVHRGHNGAAGEMDYALPSLADEADPCAGAISALAGRLARNAQTTLQPPYDTRAVFAAARAGDQVAQSVVENVAHRIARHVAPIAAVTDVALVVLGGGVGTNGDLLLGPICEQLAEWLPFPPRVEVSGLADAAVLTGALAVGLGIAQERVFANRRAAGSPAAGS
jgi:predicted NBD/HSP70 family sugar kinase